MDRFEYAEARLSSGESFLIREKGVNLYDGNEKTSFEGGEVVLTSHRLLWARPGDIPRGLTCLSLPLRYVVFVEEETGSTSFGFSRSKKIVLHLSQALPGKIPGPVNRSSHHYMKLSFKEGLNSNFVQIINETIQSKKWENFSPAATPSQASDVKLRAGIVGIERGIQEKQKAADESISRAFQDLSKLMGMAKDMVNLSKNISQKIRERQGDITEDETVRFKSYLLSLGIDDPVTRTDFRSENKYYIELARQLADILEEPITDVGGMMALTDVYCRVNRARGLELLSPEDLIQACHMLEKLNLPLRLRQFDSGVKVLQLHSHSDVNVVKNTALALEDQGSLTAEELAQMLGISVLLAKERLMTTEKYGKACRDESIEGLRFYPNQFLQRED
ncbi:vacuolar protein-sorting-associated protein 36 isoform X2 [Zootermopsis nevadensis]|uniref:Vacuolar protein-sorting-associated protein 36 n=1 Tax=Zootermopsis nevadensis TaxID=136037 RepID=A0A067QSM3_ZOONE|nr:vacuolar protein-sorting-associated protein 36 isoform X2 [Zootermopsis nevadensis]XP_021932181.1 vacuolar protein-sorting-associated protein 36 isoform X2 [Zootermopsis nevadensis]XP_021932182.1 vacuolar protein-sorting-associated protein 36 isoform X2 [Zootermopsis nevadensis]XP_021932184.1 vacuolar protein-sorting-associated protein 36 isoform X2 [Zootermopsis nevadensis]KDR12870.1 Vacuolar protein-sorting-associated protein 36 [Zootermopsis nevadensis]